MCFVDLRIRTYGLPDLFSKSSDGRGAFSGKRHQHVTVQSVDKGRAERLDAVAADQVFRCAPVAPAVRGDDSPYERRRLIPCLLSVVVGLGEIQSAIGERKFSALLAVGHPGKLAKLIDGHWNTHSSASPPALDTVVQLARRRLELELPKLFRTFDPKLLLRFFPLLRFPLGRFLLWLF